MQNQISTQLTQLYDSKLELNKLRKDLNASNKHNESTTETVSATNDINHGLTMELNLANKKIMNLKQEITRLNNQIKLSRKTDDENFMNSNLSNATAKEQSTHKLTKK